MNISKKALSLLLSVTLIASTVVSTSAFAETANSDSGNGMTQTTETVESAKKSLQEEIDKCTGYTENLYSPKLWTTFHSALTGSKEYMQISEELTAGNYLTEGLLLETARKNMDNDRTTTIQNLETLITGTEGMAPAEAEHGYDSSSYATLTTALTNAKALTSGSATYKEITDKITALNNAIKTCQQSNVAISNLNGLVETAQAVNNVLKSHTLTAAINTAQSVADAPATIEAVEEATSTLKGAIEAAQADVEKSPTEQQTLSNGFTKDISAVAKNGNASSADIARAVAEISLLPDEQKKALSQDALGAIDSKLKDIHKITEQVNVQNNNQTYPLTSASVNCLSLAAGITNETNETIALAIQQTAPKNGETIEFTITLNKENQPVSALSVPVTVTVPLPSTFLTAYPASSYDYTVTHNGTPITSNVSGNNISFETPSFSPFAIIAKAKQSGGNTTGGGSTTGSVPTTGTSTTPDHPSFVSDTNSALSVSNAYTFKITSKDGKAPQFAVGTPGTFIWTLVKQGGNDYFYKITSIGSVGAQAGIYVNGEKLLVATVKSSACNFVSDTYAPLSVNGAYTFKITSKDGKAPQFAVGTPGVFSTSLVNHTGNDYFYKITAIGAPGEKAGIYVNGFGCLLVATVKTNPSYVVSDTKGSFKVKAGQSYQFKLTANAKPTFWAGTSSVFKVAYVKNIGNDYFFRITAVAKAGNATGFYIKGQKGPVAVAAVA